MTYEMRFHSGDVELRESDGVSKIVGYAAVFNRYSDNLGGFVEQIAPGAFTRTMNDPHAEVQAWFNHNPDNLLASRINGSLVLSQDERGLKYEVTIDESDPDHLRVLSKIRRGDLRGSSFGFLVEQDSWSTTDDDYPLRTIERVAALRDVGPVSVPAYPDTAMVGAIALRSLAVLVDRPVGELVAANDLKDFLMSLRAEDGDSENAADDGAASEDPDAASEPERSRLVMPPRVSRAWHAEYL